VRRGSGGEGGREGRREETVNGGRGGGVGRKGEETVIICGPIILLVTENHFFCTS
jgi:hypothetical protein